MATAAFPALCEVAIVCGTDNGTHVVSQVLAAGVPIVKFIDDIRDSINIELDQRGMAPLAAADYRLTRIDGVRLDSGRTLQELGVINGLWCSPRPRTAIPTSRNTNSSRPGWRASVSG